MQLHLDPIGLIPANYPKTFYRVEDYRSGRRIADFTNLDEAISASFASKTGLRFDHKVATITIVGR